jgi:transposase
MKSQQTMEWLLGYPNSERKFLFASDDDARHAKAALRMQINKSGRNDAADIARIMQCGLYKEVRVKALKRDLENQIRGLLKNFGLVIWRAKMNTFTAKALDAIDGQPAAIEPLLKAREALTRQIAALDRKLLRLARSEPQVRRFMTVPGVGPITALCYLATIGDPARFKKSRSVGAYVG